MKKSKGFLYNLSYSFVDEFLFFFQTCLFICKCLSLWKGFCNLSIKLQYTLALFVSHLFAQHILNVKSQIISHGLVVIDILPVVEMVGGSNSAMGILSS